ncbi:MAG: hypothetical protein JXA41_00430 [Deltaproteobacteria bacterium]|nr:hypothetical protein [Deltaproteobacteria bacterium]
MRANVNNILKTLERMADLERAVAEFYKTAAEAFPDDAPFWKQLSKAEVKHADYIGRMADILKRKPEKFEGGRPFNVTAAEFFIANLKKSQEQLKIGGFNKKQLLFTALDTEQAILESKYAEILDTKDVEYQTLISEIAVETDQHKQSILDKIDEIK